jgi:3-hydroxyisobutyrate dehydrogenase/2-hydroxy-3-oxopropionate reductase
MPTVAMVGLGRMGSAMARRFHGAGYDLVLWNRDPAKSEAVAADIGAPVASTPAEAASRADIVFSSLADDDALREVYLGGDGVVSGIQTHTIAIDSSTVDPQVVIEVGTAVDATGAVMIDCPVSGSVPVVEAGALTVMAGGPEEVIASVEPLLLSIAKQVIRVGDRGAGAACKLAVNGLVHGLNVALSEALVLAEKAGVRRDIAYDVFAGGVGGAPFVQYKREAFEHPEDATVAFSLDLVAKDLELITGLGRRVGAPMAQAQTGLEIVKAAIDSGLRDADMSAVAVYLRGDSA